MAEVQYKVSTWGPWYKYSGPHLPVPSNAIVELEFVDGRISNIVASTFNWNNNASGKVLRYRVRTGEVYP